MPKTKKQKREGALARRLEDRSVYFMAEHIARERGDVENAEIFGNGKRKAEEEIANLRSKLGHGH